MCGHDRDIHNYEEVVIGLNIRHVKVYTNGSFSREYAKDDLLSNTWFSDPYVRPLTDNDINSEGLKFPSTIAEGVKKFLNDRKAYMRGERPATCSIQ
jgi:hypothetical protein